MKQKKTLVMILGVLLAAAVVVGLIFGIKALSGKPDASDTAASTAGADSAAKPDSTAASGQESTAADQESTAASGQAETQETQQPPELTPEMQAVKRKEVYTAEGIQADDPRLDQTVASCGSYSLTNRQAQVYYVMDFYGFMSNYGAMLGVDDTKPLSEQPSMVDGLNWEQYFVLSSMQAFQQYAAAATKATETGYVMGQEDQEHLESILSGLEEDAKSQGFDSAEAYLQDSLGTGVGLAEYENYLRTYFLAMSYENKLYEDLSWTDEDLLAYRDAHPEEFEGIDPEVKCVNVRHILITPDAADGASEEEVAAANAAAKEKAEELLAGFRNNPSEEYFAQLAQENTEDPGSKTTGGLYEDVLPGQMVQAFNDWCFDAARQSGDSGIVETSYGYHVMYFVGQSEKYHWQAVAEENYPVSRMDSLIEEMLDANPLNVRYEDLVLAPLPQPAAE